MQEKTVYYGYVDVLDKTIFTQKKATEWKKICMNHIKQFIFNLKR